MDISEFIEEQRILTFLELKLQKTENWQQSGTVSLNAGEISTLQRKALHPVQLVLLFRKV